MEVGFGALTGSPLGFTGARVPAASALRCSRWICVARGKVVREEGDLRMCFVC
jgi:hypothetical protein